MGIWYVLDIILPYLEHVGLDPRTNYFAIYCHFPSAELLRELLRNADAIWTGHMGEILCSMATQGLDCCGIAQSGYFDRLLFQGLSGPGRSQRPTTQAQDHQDNVEGMSQEQTAITRLAASTLLWLKTLGRVYMFDLTSDSHNNGLLVGN